MTKHFKLTPKNVANTYYTNKDQNKADLANKYIGFGVENSSTESYYKDAINAKIPANVDKYTNTDVVFVSVNGGFGFNEKNGLKTNKLVIEALESGATIIMDNDYHRNRGYNSGERFVHEAILNYVKEHGKNMIYKEKDNYCLINII